MTTADHNHSNNIHYINGTAAPPLSPQQKRQEVYSEYQQWIDPETTDSNFTYFMIGNETITYTHSKDAILPLPTFPVKSMHDTEPSPRADDLTHSNGVEGSSTIKRKMMNFIKGRNKKSLTSSSSTLQIQGLSQEDYDDGPPPSPRVPPTNELTASSSSPNLFHLVRQPHETASIATSPSSTNLSLSQTMRPLQKTKSTLNLGQSTGSINGYATLRGDTSAPSLSSSTSSLHSNDSLSPKTQPFSFTHVATMRRSRPTPQSVSSPSSPKALLSPQKLSPSTSPKTTTATQWKKSDDSIMISSKKDDIDRADWKTKMLRKHPNIKELKERIQPLERTISFGRTFYSKSADAGEGVNDLSVIELIHQHLKNEGLRASVIALEEESAMQYTDHDLLEESRLMTLLKIAIKDVDRIYHHTIADGFIRDSAAVKQELEEDLESLGILEEEDTTEDVNIWDEPTDKNILWDKKDTKDTTFEKTTIRAASLNKLIEKLTTVSNPDLKWGKIFLMMYRSFTKPEILLAKLIQRYHVPDDYKGEGDIRTESVHTTKTPVSSVAFAIKLKVVNILRQWVHDQWEDFVDNKKLLQSIYFFAEYTLVADGHGNLSTTLLSALNRQQRNIVRPDIVHPIPPPEPKVPKNIFSPTLDILDIDEEEFARQLTLVEFSHFTSIKSAELLNQNWSKPKLKHRSPNVCRMIDRFNDFTNFVALSILKESKIRQRVRMMTRYVKIAEHLRIFNNFNNCMAILAAFSLTPIHRLKWTREELSASTLKTWSEIEKNLSSENGYKAYRDTIKKVTGPCIPFLGVDLTDLTLMDECNPDTIGDLINFSKRNLMAGVINKLQQSQSSPYNFLPIPQIAAFFKHLPKLNEDDLLRVSQQREPKGKPRIEIE